MNKNKLLVLSLSAITILFGFMAQGDVLNSAHSTEIIGVGRAGVGDIPAGTFCQASPAAIEKATKYAMLGADQNALNQCTSSMNANSMSRVVSSARVVRTTEYAVSSRCTVRGAFLQIQVQAHYQCTN